VNSAGTSRAQRRSGAVFLPARGFCCCRARSGSARSS